MTGRRAARPRRPPWAPISNPACGRDRCRSSSRLYTRPCLIDRLLRSRSIHTTLRRLSAQSYRVTPADHPVAVPEKHGSTGNERPKTRFLGNNFGNGGPMFGPLCRIMRNYTADIFTIDLAGYSYRWRKFRQVGQTKDTDILIYGETKDTDIRETCTYAHGWSFLYSWWGGCPTNFVFCHTNCMDCHANFQWIFDFSDFKMFTSKKITHL